MSLYCSPPRRAAAGCRSRFARPQLDCAPDLRHVERNEVESKHLGAIYLHEILRLRYVSLRMTKKGGGSESVFRSPFFNYLCPPMLQPGQVYTLTISRISPHGLYLADAEGEEVLLPNRYVSLQDKVGEQKEVFLYHDSENRLVATTARPLALVGQVAALEVADVTDHGVFLEWGADVPKDVFVPLRNQLYPMHKGRTYVVMLYNDNITGRVTATPKLRGFISNDEVALQPGEQVQIVVTQRLDAGFRVVVNDKHFGMIYHNQIFRPAKSEPLQN